MSAVNRLREYFKFDPKNIDIALQLIEALANQGDFDEALFILNEAKQYHIDEPMLISWSAHLGLATSDFKSAITAYNQLFELGYSQTGLIVNSALAHYQLGDYRRAKKLLDSVEDLDVTNKILKARCNAQLEETIAAITDVNSLLTLCSDEQLPEILGLLSLLYLDDAQYDLAKEYCEKTLSLDDKQFDARLTAASLALYKIRIDDALSFIEPLDKEYPDTGRIIAMKALVYMYLQRFDLAINLYERACEKMPAHVGSRINLGWCFFSVGEKDKAKQCFNDGVKIDRTFAESHGGLALISALSEEWSESQVHFKRALKLDPLSPSALFARSLYFKSKGREKEAESIVSGLINHKSELSEVTLKDIVSSFFQKSS
ncbi:tetratricopeptide repeat protein [Photobacterium leiognathi]|uniref:tetratricopeptide repeat protein n=1 Tax=Photobacterium leiognathi TaxID=553611 RepID=UPI002980FC56|nr:tetratricopeptide repeat protein [Photobacterium leiognathi]